MKEKIKKSWIIFNEASKNAIWFWINIAVGVALFASMIYLLVTYTLVTFF